jgi:hypothetical protein
MPCEVPISVRSMPTPKNTVSYSENGTPKRTEAPGVVSEYSSPRLLNGRLVR